MISEATFYGGAVYYSTAATRQLHWKSKRVITISNGSASMFILPLTDITPLYYSTLKQGGPSFYIINKGAGSVTIRQSDSIGNTLDLATLTTNKVALITLRGTPTAGGAYYTITQYTLNTSRTSYHGSRAAVTSPAAAPTTYNTYCFEGDLCDRITYVGSGVSIPMFQNPCDALNSHREPIRAADFRMPSVIPVTITRDSFAIDSNHPYASSITPETLEALWNDDRPWQASYVGPLHGKSYHWHHMRWAYSGAGAPYGAWDLPTGGTNDFRRHYWKATKAYTVDGTSYTMELRVVAEHTVDPEPILVSTPAITLTSTQHGQTNISATTGSITDQYARFINLGFKANQIIEVTGFTAPAVNGTFRILQVEAGRLTLEGAWGVPVTFGNKSFGDSVTITTVTAGGQGSSTVGAWGSLLHVYVFTNQILYGSSDPISYTPNGSGSSIAFSRDNPAHGGITSGQDEALKFCHPQMIVCAAVTTNMEAPCGVSWIPVDKRNRASCYALPNYLPWIPSPGCCGTPATLNGLLYNSMFGSPTLAAMWATTTIGGDFPTSLPLEWLVIENSLEDGITPLAPLATLAGWDATTGALTVEAGNAMSIRFCDAGQRSADTCDGHIDEPFEGIGGTHYCFRTEASGAFCCVPIQGSDKVGKKTKIRTQELCKRTTTRYDEACVFVDETCTITGKFITDFEVPIDDYTYCMNSNPLLRQIEFHDYVRRVDALYYNWPPPTGTGVDGDWNSYFGTVAVTGTTAPLTALAANPVGGLILYEPAGSSHADCTISADVELATVTPPGGDVYEAGLCVRASVTAGDTTCYAILAATDGSIRLVKIIADVVTVLASLPAGSPILSTTMSLTIAGATLTATVGDGYTVTIDDCAIESTTVEHPGLIVLDSDSDTITWTNIALQDNTLDSTNWAEVSNVIRVDGHDVDVDGPAANGYGQCTGEYNIGCGTTLCNCTTWVETMQRDLNASFSNATYATHAGGYGAHPTCWEGPGNTNCTSGTVRCGPCPPPFITIQTLLPDNCDVLESESSICTAAKQCGNPILTTTSRLCQGISNWMFSEEFCA